MKRWYDKHERLSVNLEKLRTTQAAERDSIVKEIIHIIRQNSPRLFEDFVMEFPLDIFRRRWYDNDPYLWLVVNGLRHAENDLIQRVTAHLETVFPDS